MKYPNKHPGYKNITFQKYVESHNPLIPGYIPIIIGIKIFEYSVHKDVVGHIKTAVEKLPGTKFKTTYKIFSFYQSIT